MKVSVDQEKCVASGQCVMTSPEVFDQDDEEGLVVLVEETPPQEAAGAVRQAAAMCPASAIAVED